MYICVYYKEETNNTFKEDKFLVRVENGVEKNLKMLKTLINKAWKDLWCIVALSEEYFSLSR